MASTLHLVIHSNESPENIAHFQGILAKALPGAHCKFVRVNFADHMMNSVPGQGSCNFDALNQKVAIVLDPLPADASFEMILGFDRALKKCSKIFIIFLENEANGNTISAIHAKISLLGVLGRVDWEIIPTLQKEFAKRQVDNLRVLLNLPATSQVLQPWQKVTTLVFSLGALAFATTVCLRAIQSLPKPV